MVCMLSGDIPGGCPLAEPLPFLTASKIKNEFSYKPSNMLLTIGYGLSLMGL